MTMVVMASVVITDPQTAAEAVIGVLKRTGSVTDAQIERAQRAAEANGDRIDIVLNKLGLVTDEVLLAAYEEITGKVAVDSSELHGEPQAIEGIDPSFFASWRLVPLHEVDTGLIVATADPLDERPIQALAYRLGKRVEPRLASRSVVDAALGRLRAGHPDRNSIDMTASDAVTDDIDRLKDIASEAPIIRLVSELIDGAAKAGASDIHLSRTAEDGRVRFRIDGRLSDVRRLTPVVHQAVVSRLKIMAALDIGERRVPQDGRIQVAVGGRQIDLRLSTMPHAHGEGAFVRILDHRATKHDLAALGLSAAHVATIKSVLSHAHGLFLVTGPTGSGKTTTLYAALEYLNDPSKNIITVEDPIEYSLSGINQIQVNRRAGLDFARALRSVLRQDPDIIMVGEIRDRETAAIAIQAALTGHFVLATLHTNDALSAIDRLIDMEVEAFLLAAVLRGAMAQRLVRRLCPICHGSGHRPNERITDSERRCDACSGSGFAGRVPLVEVVPIDREASRMIADRAGSPGLVKVARQQGHASLEMDGARLVADGLTTQAEVLRAIGG